MSIYSNYQHINFDEARYQTIGRGHGFTELDGVTFKIAEKYTFVKPSPNLINQLSALCIESERRTNQAYSYTFELENKVLKNMAVKRY